MIPITSITAVGTSDNFVVFGLGKDGAVYRWLGGKWTPLAG